jgi:hypothetical protein
VTTWPSKALGLAWMVAMGVTCTLLNVNVRVLLAAIVLPATSCTLSTRTV